MEHSLHAIRLHIFRYNLRYLTALFFILFILLAVLRWKNILNNGETVIAAGQTLVVLAILFSGFQFRANHDWNRRQLAAISAKEVKLFLRKDIETIDKHFNYTNRRQHESIKVETIHKKICLLDEQGNLKYTDGKLMVDHNGDGAEIESALSNILNGFEYLATGVDQCVFDEEIIYKLYGGSILRVAGIFNEYIHHINTDMYPGRRGKIYENLKSLAARFEEREKDAKKTNRAETG